MPASTLYPADPAPRSVVIVGSGVVGTATGAGLSAKGHDVVFCDISWERVALLRARGFDAIHAGELVHARPDAYLISVPTPTKDGRVDISYVRDAARTIGSAIASHPAWPLVVVRSTVPPGTTEDVVIPEIEKASARSAGRGFGVCMNPEFLRAVSAAEDFLAPRVIVIGSLDGRSENALRAIYAPWAGVPVIAMPLISAEATKYVSNLFNATKISFYNEMHRALTRIGADAVAAFEAVTLGAEGMWNPSYGTRGGAPYGGVCLPKDTVGFLGFARDAGFEHLMPVLRATIQVNDELAAEADAGEGAGALAG